MPKNKGKGGKNRRRGKNENEKDKRELILKEPGQEYGQVTRILGNGHVEAFCFDGKRRICHIRGKMRKKVWVNNGDIVLIGLRDFQDDRGDVILKYSSDEAKSLKSIGEFPENVRINENTTQTNDMDDHDISFDLKADEISDDEVPAQQDRYNMPETESSEGEYSC